MLGIMKIMNLSSLALSLLFVVACIKDNKENVEEDVLSLNTKISLSTAEWMSIAYDNPKEYRRRILKLFLIILLVRNMWYLRIKPGPRAIFLHFTNVNSIL